MLPTPFRALAILMCSVGLPLVACSSAPPPSSEPTLDSTQEAVSCQPGKSCVVPQPPAPPVKPPVCAVRPRCDGHVRTSGFDPLMAPTSTGKWIADPTFAALLAEHGCAPEISFTGACDPTETDADGSCEAPIVGTAICPDDIVSAVTAYDVKYNTGITAEIPCDTCTGQPSANQVVIAWVVQVAGTEVPCFPAAGLTCSVPGAGCKAVNCFVQY